MGESLTLSWRRAGSGHGEAWSPSGCVGDPGPLGSTVPEATRGPSKPLAERQPPGAGHTGLLREDCGAMAASPSDSRPPSGCSQSTRALGRGVEVAPGHETSWVGRARMPGGQEARSRGGAPSRGHGEHPGRREGTWAVGRDLPQPRAGGACRLAGLWSAGGGRGAGRAVTPGLVT